MRFGVSLYQDEELFEMKLKKLELTDTFMCAFRAEQKHRVMTMVCVDIKTPSILYNQY